MRIAKKKMPRLFIAIDLNDEMKDSLMGIQDAMRDHGMRGRETVPENMHLTLAFIGDFGDAGLVKEVVESVELRPFRIKLSGIGAYGDLWWAGLEDSPPLLAVSRRLRRALAEAGIPFDRKRFSPHITLMRRATGTAADIPAGELDRYFDASMTVDHISLMRSDRGRHGMIYTEL